MEHSRCEFRTHSLHLLDSAHIDDAQIAKAVAEQRDEYKGQRWCCAVCRVHITDEAQRIRIDGEYEHHKINPQGQGFKFRCFQQAPGCARVGQLTMEHSWFSGYSWQFAFCAYCHTQLGWYFAGPHPFFGLINQNVVRCSDAKSG